MTSNMSTCIYLHVTLPCMYIHVQFWLAAACSAPLPISCGMPWPAAKKLLERILSLDSFTVAPTRTHPSSSVSRRRRRSRRPETAVCRLSRCLGQDCNTHTPHKASSYILRSLHNNHRPPVSRHSTAPSFARGHRYLLQDPPGQPDPSGDVKQACGGACNGSAACRNGAGTGRRPRKSSICILWVCGLSHPC